MNEFNPKNTYNIKSIINSWSCHSKEQIRVLHLINLIGINKNNPEYQLKKISKLLKIPLEDIKSIYKYLLKNNYISTWHKDKNVYAASKKGITLLEDHRNWTLGGAEPS